MTEYRMGMVYGGIDPSDGRPRWFRGVRRVKETKPPTPAVESTPTQDQLPPLEYPGKTVKPKETHASHTAKAMDDAQERVEGILEEAKAKTS